MKKRKPHPLIVNGIFNETDLQDLIKALKVAGATHDRLVTMNAEAMTPEERIRHLDRASRYNDLSIKIQNI